MHTSEVNQSSSSSKACRLLTHLSTYKALQAIRKQVKLEFGEDLRVRTPDEAIELLRLGKRSMNVEVVRSSTDIETALAAVDFNGTSQANHAQPVEESEKPKRMYRGVPVG